MVFGRKINVVVPCIFCALFLSCTPKVDSTKTTENVNAASSSIENQQLENIDGFWVSEKYLACLKANRNPFKENPESLEIDIQSKKLTWTNFHEGYWRHIFEYGKEQKSYYLKVSEPESSSTNSELTQFSIVNDVLIFNDSNVVSQINERFTRISSELPIYANKIILAGRYKDAEGKIYEFTETGNAIWPELKFDYELALDSSEANCPYINSSMKDNEGYPKRFGYKWESEFLYIFEIVETEEAPISCTKEVYLKLVKE